MGEVKGHCHIVHPVSNRCTSFLFHINLTNHTRDVSNSVWPWKNISKIFKEYLAKTEFPTEFLQHSQSDIATKFCSDWLSGSDFILQISKFLFINVTAVTLGQSDQKVTRYIFSDLYLLCPKYIRFSWNVFDVRSKSLCAASGRGRRGGGNELKT